jgi:phytoene synthase
MEDPSDLDALVRRVDPHRWLSSRFVADPARRADLITLYAFDHELARVAVRVSNPMLGEIRLAWWGEVLDEAYGGREVRAHPTAQALAEVIRRRELPRAPLDRMIEGRAADLSGEPFGAEPELVAYLDAAWGGIADAAVALLAPGARAPVGAGRAWGLAHLRRTPPLPPERLAARARAEVDAARAEAARLPAPAFPAVAHATLAPALAAGRRVAEGPDKLRLTLAVALGRL